MIFDNIENAYIYYTLGEKIKKGFEFIKNNNLASMPCGRHDIEEGIYANVQELETKLPHLAKFEAHREYIDIQYVISGSERMDFALINNFAGDIPYDKEKDVEFLKLKEDSSCPNVINVKTGDFAIFFPQDVHAPMLSCGDGIEKIKKVIVKIKAD